MNKLLTSVAVAALMAAVPAIAQDAAKDDQRQVWAENQEMLEQEGQNREPGPDGTFQGKPVVEGPADWKGKVGSASDDDSATTGSSTGESGSD